MTSTTTYIDVVVSLIVKRRSFDTVDRIDVPKYATRTIKLILFYFILVKGYKTLNMRTVQGVLGVDIFMNCRHWDRFSSFLRLCAVLDSVKERSYASKRRCKGKLCN